MPRPRRPTTDSRPRGEHTPARVRSDLEEQYAAVFGCSWEQAPWGRAWKEIFNEAEAADRAYREAEEALAAIASALAQGRAVLKGHGIAIDAPFSEERAVGLTTPEYALYYFFSAEDRVARKALEWADWILGTITLPARQKAAGDEWAKDGLVRGNQEAMNGNVPAFLEACRYTLDAAYRRGSVRRLLAWDRHPNTGEALGEPVMRACFPGPPPRKPGSREWRGGILVELLDGYPLRTMLGEWRMTNDEEIAVVSLLHGLLDELGDVPEARKGAKHLRTKESKAIREARRRRGLGTGVSNNLRAALARDNEAVAPAATDSGPDVAGERPPG